MRKELQRLLFKETRELQMQLKNDEIQFEKLTKELENHRERENSESDILFLQAQLRKLREDMIGRLEILEQMWKVGVDNITREIEVDSASDEEERKDDSTTRTRNSGVRIPRSLSHKERKTTKRALTGLSFQHCLNDDIHRYVCQINLHQLRKGEGFPSNLSTPECNGNGQH